MSTDNLTTEIPLSSRTPLGSVTMEDSSHGFNESRSVMTKDNLKLLDLSTADNFCENRGREIEYAASLADECEESVRFFLILVSLFYVEVSVTRPVFHIWYCTRGFLFRLKIVLPPSWSSYCVPGLFIRNTQQKAWNRQEAWYGLEQTLFASKL